MPILRSLLLLVVLFTPAPVRTARGPRPARKMPHRRYPAAELFRQVFDLEQLVALPPPKASDILWVLDWFDAAKETYKKPRVTPRPGNSEALKEITFEGPSKHLAGADVARLRCSPPMTEMGHPRSDACGSAKVALGSWTAIHPAG